MAGQPTKYKPEFCKIAQSMCKLGAIDKDLAEALNVTEQTVNNWKLAHSEFFESLKLGKEEVDERVKQALVHKALGYSHPDTDLKVIEGSVVETPMIKHYPPDTTACIFWLKNRQPKDFRASPEPFDNDEDTPPIKIDFTVKSAVGDVEVTNAGA